APTPPLSPPPPISAVPPSVDSATPEPKWPLPLLSSLAVSFGPCWRQPPGRVNIHAAPALASSNLPPISAVPPSAESATLPNCAWPLSSLAASFGPCWVQALPERVKTH